MRKALQVYNQKWINVDDADDFQVVVQHYVICGDSFDIRVDAFEHMDIIQLIVCILSAVSFCSKRGSYIRHIRAKAKGVERNESNACEEKSKTCKTSIESREFWTILLDNRCILH